MEKPARTSKGRIFSFLPKTATVSFQNPPFSPGRDKRITENSVKFFKPNYHNHNGYKSFSGPIISIIPVEARTKSKNGSFDTQEPTSPKVSCIGQIKHKNKICKSKRVPKSQSPPNQIDHEKKPKQKLKPSSSMPTKEKPKPKPKRSSSSIRNIFRGAISGWKSSNSSNVPSNYDNKPPVGPERAPSLGQMKRFASGRSGLADFDWRDFAGDHDLERKYHSDEEKEQSEEEEEEIIIPHSAPIMVGGGRVALEPRKEINLWKRRTVSPISPLELN